MAVDEQKVQEAVGKVTGRVLADAGYTRVCRVAHEAAPFNIVLEARP